MHFMNPQRAAHMGLPQDQMQTGEPEKGDGSEQSGYAGPQYGPFECENCQHFSPPGTCNHPTVQSDPEVQGKVEPEGCCNYFKSAGQEPEEQEQPNVSNE